MVQPVAHTQVLHRNLGKEKIGYLLNKYDLRAMFQRNLRCLQTTTWMGIAVITLAALGLGTGAFCPGIPFALYAMTLLAIIEVFTFGYLTNYEKFQKMTSGRPTDTASRAPLFSKRLTSPPGRLRRRPRGNGLSGLSIGNQRTLACRPEFLKTLLKNTL